MNETEKFNRYDVEDCEACGEKQDVCDFHEGVEWGLKIALGTVIRALEDGESVTWVIGDNPIKQVERLKP